MEIVEIKKGEPTTTTLAIAEGCKTSHKGVIQLVRQYRNDLEEFGLLAFEMRPRLDGVHGGGDVEYALLNERQSTLVMTYMRNNPVVRDFKKRLVSEFWNLVKLNEKSSSVMEQFAEALKRMEADKDLASIHGKALARWKSVRLEHIEAVTAAHSKAQLLLNFN
jgi:phage regulator Rha-like protein